MTTSSSILVRISGVAALVALAGCVGVPEPAPVSYAPGYTPQTVYQQPGYQQPGYQQPAYQRPGYEQHGYQQPGFEQQPQSGYAPPVQAAAYGSTCYAGVYTCALPQQLPVGAQCSCPGLGAPSYGNVR